MEDGPFKGDVPIQIMIFRSYVNLPEGNTINTMGYEIPSLKAPTLAETDRKLPAKCRLL